MQRLDLAIKTLFSEFQESVQSRVAIEHGLRRDSTFIKKRIKGKLYWYRQTSRHGKQTQSYLGPTNAKREQQIDMARKQRRQKQATVRQLRAAEQKRAAVLRKAGLPALAAPTSSWLKHLSELGVCYEYGVLVGSLAFAAYSGMMGFLFERASLKTLDIDIVRDEYDLDQEGSLLEVAQLFPAKMEGFQPIPALSLKQLSSSFLGPHGLRLDILFPLRGRAKQTYQAPGIAGAGAQALRFLDYLIEDPLSTVLIGASGGIPVSVPQPTRFALHKIMVGTRRGTHELAKRQKDFLQASQLIIACYEEQPHELKMAYRAAMKRGKKWEAAIKRSLKVLSPEAVECLSKL